MSLDIQDLVEHGFDSRFVRIGDFRRNFGSFKVPYAMGSYVVCSVDYACEFLSKSTGGTQDGKDPTVSLDFLEKHWVHNAHVLYYGKAGGVENNNNTLNSRLREYMRCANGLPHYHWGGRLIWQLKNSDELLISWMKTEVDPLEVEEALLLEFYFVHGALPFANLRF